jgi:hypothetical protein
MLDFVASEPLKNYGIDHTDICPLDLVSMWKTPNIIPVHQIIYQKRHVKQILMWLTNNLHIWFEKKLIGYLQLQKLVRYSTVLRIRDIWSEHFSISNPNIFYSGFRILHKKSDENKNYRYLFSCSLWIQKQVLIVKKIIHPGSRKKFSRIQGVKKHRIPDLESRIRNTGPANVKISTKWDLAGSLRPSLLYCKENLNAVL